MKQYKDTIEGQKRYSPGECCGSIKTPITRTLDSKHISTNYSERLKLTIRMQDRRLTRLTNAFSKKLENHVASAHLHNFYYNSCRVHKSLRVTPAMAAGITDRVWSIADVVALVEAKEREAAMPKPSGLVPVRRKSA